MKKIMIPSLVITILICGYGYYSYYLNPRPVVKPFSLINGQAIFIKEEQFKKPWVFKFVSDLKRVSRSGENLINHEYIDGKLVPVD